MTNATQLPQVLIVTGDANEHTAYKQACQDRLTPTFLSTDQEITQFVTTITEGNFIAIVIGLIPSMRLRIGPVSIVRYAQNFDKNLLLAGVCKSNEWQKMIVDKGAHHACSNPTEAIDWIVSEICKRE